MSQKKKISYSSEPYRNNWFSRVKKFMNRFLSVSDKEGEMRKVSLLKPLSSRSLIKKDCNSYIPYTKTVVGVIDVKSTGYAFVKVENFRQDIFIPKYKTLQAFEGDKVIIRFLKRPYGKRIEGEVVKIINRKRIFFVGTFQLNDQKKYGFVIVEGKGLHVDFYIPKGKFKEAKNAQKVIVKFVGWPKHLTNPIGEIDHVLGDQGDQDTEMNAILYQYDLPYTFSRSIEEQAKKISSEITIDEIARRRDMRKEITFTIDPENAKDFDDALSIKLLKNARWEIGVHIADVSYYIEEGSLLDKEAYKRATSVYLVDRVIPMLPEALSNNLCSLKPKEDKLCFSAIFEIDESGRLFKSWFGKTIIRSNRRFTYEEAQERILSGQGDFSKEIIQLNKLAKKLREKRLKRGAIGFDKLEIKFSLDEQNEPVGFSWKESKEAHQLIEEFMLLANSKIAKFISLDSKGEKSGRTYVYRIHNDPDMDKLSILNQFIKPLGYTLNLKNRKTITSSMNALLIAVRGKPEQHIIDSLAMRAMSKAKYSTKNIGHYGLAFAYYTHFTSPIRRYPDIIAHRLLQHYLNKGKIPLANTYEEQCLHAGNRERLAVDAERDSIKYMQVKYMKRFIGDEFDGIISGVTEWGIYVELSIAGAEGLIRLKDMNDDIYIFKSEQYCIEGKDKQRKYRLGDTVRIKLLNADMDRKQLELQWLYT